MPDFWQFPTVSMGLGPLMAIYQARFLKYLHHRGLADTANRKVWAFMGDGEMDEPESLGAISLGGREKLDNLVFVINCNLQRLDGPVRGNGKIIQELEGDFRGAGWNVIKVLWGSALGPADRRGHRRPPAAQRMEECVDGEYQDFKSKNGAYVREHFFGKYPELQGAGRRHVRRGDLEPDPRRPRSAARSTPPMPRRSTHKGQPTVILAKTVKGYGMGEAGEGQNITHQQKKMGEARAARSSATASACRSPTSRSRRCRSSSWPRTARRWPTCASAGAALGGNLPARRRKSESLADPAALGLRRPARRAPRGARSRPRWRSCASSTRCCATSRSASAWCRSCRTRAAPSAWRACSASSASSARSASSTSRRTPTS